MALSDSSYSRIVAVLKVTLPLLALAILSTLFLLARAPDPDATLPFITNGGADFAGEQRIARPSFVGVTSDGAAILLEADVVRPDTGAEKAVLGEGLRALIETPGGGTIKVASSSGTIDVSAGTASLEGDVRIETSTGYVIRTSAFAAHLSDTYAETTGGVTADTPAGSLAAGQMILQVTPDGRHVLVFQDGVKLIYDPPSQK